MNSSTTKKFLVIGGSSMVGQRFLEALGPENAVGTYCRNPFLGGIKWDVLTDELPTMSMLFMPTHVLILAGRTGIDQCAADRAASEAINVDAIIRLLEWIGKTDIVPIFVSSDAVYEDRPNCNEWPDPHEHTRIKPSTIYGKQKFAVEKYIRENWSVPERKFLIFRPSKILDPCLHPAGLLGPWLKSYYWGPSIGAFIDRYFNPIDVRDLIQAILMMTELNEHGTFNVGGQWTFSYCDLALNLARRCFDAGIAINPQIQLMSLKNVTFAQPRSFDSSINNARLCSFGWEPRPVEDTCDDAISQFVRSLDA